MASNYGAPRQTGWGNDRQAAPMPTISVSDITLAAPVPINLFADIAQEKAARVYEAGEGRKNKSTQLRKFYDELVMWFDKVHLERSKEARASKYTELAPFIKMMNAKVAEKNIAVLHQAINDTKVKP